MTTRRRSTCRTATARRSSRPRARPVTGWTKWAKFKGYNTKDEWRDVVVTMVKYGAELKEPEIEVLVDYLGKHLSKNQ